MVLKLIGGAALLVTGFVAWQICQTPQKLGLAEIVGDPASLATGSGAPGADHIPASLFTAGADPICSLAPEGYMPMQIICDGEIAKVVFIPIDRMMGPETGRIACEPRSPSVNRVWHTGVSRDVIDVGDRSGLCPGG